MRKGTNIFWKAVAKRELLFTGSKFLVLLLLLFFLYRSVLAPARVQDFERVWDALWGRGNFFLVLALLLVPVNWGLEAFKWWLLANKLEQVSWWRAFRAVMVGLTLGFVTPNRVGDYAGRILELKSRRRGSAIGAILLGRLSQLLLTVLAGSAGLLYFLSSFYFEGYSAALLGVVVLLLFLNLGCFLFYFQSRVLVVVFRHVQPLQRFLKYIRIVEAYSFREMLNVLVIAAARYSVFVLQFYFMLRLFGVLVPFKEAVAGISATFLLKSVVPSLSALTDIGMRELSAVHFFKLLEQPELLVLSASLGLWLINVALPSAAGLLFVFRMKLNGTRAPKAVDKTIPFPVAEKQAD